jgi:hypothetical protein
MDMKELSARAGIRDLVARYNLYGDTGRLDDMADLFGDAGVLEYREAGAATEYAGRNRIHEFFTSYADRLTRSGGATPLFHSLSTHVIDLVDADHAVGRSYVQMVGVNGLEEWGHYRDRYRREPAGWRLAHRRATTVGRA